MVTHTIGKSSAGRPAGASVGSTFRESDTLKDFVVDFNGAWVEVHPDSLPDNAPIVFGSDGDARMYYDSANARLVIGVKDLAGTMRDFLRIDANEQDRNLWLPHGTSVTGEDAGWPNNDSHRIRMDRDIAASTNNLGNGVIFAGRLAANGQGGSVEYTGYRANGTFAAPTANAVGETLTKLSHVGFNGTEWEQPGFFQMECAAGYAVAGKHSSRWTIMTNDSANPSSTTDKWFGFEHDKSAGILISTLAHGITGIAARTDQAGHLKRNSANGGLTIRGFKQTGDSSQGVMIESIITDTADLVKTNAAAVGVMEFRSGVKSGTAGAVLPANSNAFLWRLYNSTVLGILDADGELHLSGGLVAGLGEGALTALTGGQLRAPDVAAGGAGDVAGADLTLRPGKGTGTGDPGQLIFAVPLQAAAGDNLQSTVTAMAFDERVLTIGDNSDNPWYLRMQANRSGAGADIGILRGMWDANVVAQVILRTGADNTNKDDGRILLNVAVGGTPTTRFQVDETGIAFFGGTSVAKQSHIADPAGGGTQDAEARAAIASILDALEAYSLLATS